MFTANYNLKYISKLQNPYKKTPIAISLIKLLAWYNHSIFAEFGLKESRLTKPYFLLTVICS